MFLEQTLESVFPTTFSLIEPTIKRDMPVNIIARRNLLSGINLYTFNSVFSDG